MAFYSMENALLKFHPRKRYAIIVVFVAIVVIAIIRQLGPKVGNIFSTINSSL